MSTETSRSTVFRFDNYSLWSGSNWILKNVNLGIARGDFCVLLGANGAGKSSLLKVMADVVQPPFEQFGEFVGYEKKSHGRETEISWLSQSLSYSEDMSVREFLALEPSRARSASIEKKIFGSDGDEFGVSDLLDKRISSLSGGQWQRTRLARAAARDAALILWDEPDASLDAFWRRILWKSLLNRHERGATVVLALHRFSEVARHVTTWCGLEQGRVVFSEGRAGVFPEALGTRLFLEKGLTR